jgi:hypothetical protein
MLVDVAQLVEPRIVIPAVAGSSPVVHPRRLKNVDRSCQYYRKKLDVCSDCTIQFQRKMREQGQCNFPMKNRNNSGTEVSVKEVK